MRSRRGLLRSHRRCRGERQLSPSLPRKKEIFFPQFFFFSIRLFFFSPLKPSVSAQVPCGGLRGAAPCPARGVRRGTAEEIAFSVHCPSSRSPAGCVGRNVRG